MIRPARVDDADAVCAIVHDAYRHYIPRIGKPPGPMRDDYDRRITASQVWVLEQADEIVGLVVLEEHPGFLLLDNVAVKPVAQGKGYGRALIACAEREAVRRGYDELRLYTHALMVENIAHYTRLGFAEIERIAAEGYQRVFMAIRISAKQSDAL